MKEQLYQIIAQTGMKVLHRLFPEQFGKDSFKATDRYIEYPWALGCINLYTRDAKILDVGCSGSMLPIIISSLGFETFGIDVRDYPIRGLFNFYQDNICENHFGDNSFKIVTAISTIEHMGINEYTGEYTDFSAINEIHRILKPGGILLMSVPFGEKHQVTEFHRIYDMPRLQDLLKDFVMTYTILPSPEADYSIILIQAIK